MNKATATATVKSISRHLRKTRAFEGGLSFGLDHITWSITYPHMSTVFSTAATVITGRQGRFVPRIR